MFGYEQYMQHAFPRDDLRPISCRGHDTQGGIANTLVDSLDTLLVRPDMGLIAFDGRCSRSRRRARRQARLNCWHSTACLAGLAAVPAIVFSSVPARESI